MHTEFNKAKNALSFLAEGPFPVNLTQLAREYGINTITEASLGEIDAFMVPDDEYYSVVVNKDHLPTRKRFSIAHEIGHLLIANQSLGVQFRRPVCTGSARDPVESTCNRLAAEILMPEKPFRAIAAAHNWSMQGIHALGEVFNTSLESTLMRCVGLADAPLALVPWRPDPSKKPRHRYTITTPASSWRVLGFDRQKYLAEIPSLSQAYSQEGIYKGIVPFEVSSHRNSLPLTRLFVTESMGIGRGDTRRVFSLVHLSERSPREEPSDDSGTRTQPHPPAHALPGLLRDVQERDTQYVDRRRG